MDSEKQSCFPGLFLDHLLQDCCGVTSYLLRMRSECPQVQTYLNIQREQRAIPFATILLGEKNALWHA